MFNNPKNAVEFKFRSTNSFDWNVFIFFDAFIHSSKKNDLCYYNRFCTVEFKFRSILDTFLAKQKFTWYLEKIQI